MFSQNRFVVVVGRCVTMSTHSRQAEAVQQNWHNKDEDGQREEELFSWVEQFSRVLS